VSIHNNIEQHLSGCDHGRHGRMEVISLHFSILLAGPQTKRCCEWQDNPIMVTSLNCLIVSTHSTLNIAFMWGGGPQTVFHSFSFSFHFISFRSNTHNTHKTHKTNVILFEYAQYVTQYAQNECHFVRIHTIRMIRWLSHCYPHLQWMDLINCLNPLGSAQYLLTTMTTMQRGNIYGQRTKGAL
jgi:hypothetical protein